MAKKSKTVTHKQTVYLNKATGRFASAKYAKANPGKVIKKSITITKKR